VKENHQHFLEACRGVGELEDQVALLRNYVNGLTALVASLRSSRPTARQVGRGEGEGGTELMQRSTNPETSTQF
jgi:hypothetical protein